MMNGYKTYSLVIGGVLAAVSAYILGDADAVTTIERLFSLAAAATIRHGIKTKA